MLTHAPAGEDSAQQWSALWHIFIPQGYAKTLSELSPQQLEERRQRANGTLMQLAAFLKVEE